jgi:hypothetical protein
LEQGEREVGEGSMPILTVVSEERGRHVRGTEDMARSQQNGEKAQDGVEQNMK